PPRQRHAGVGSAQYAIVERRDGGQTGYSMKYFCSKLVAILVSLFLLVSVSVAAPPAVNDLLSSGHMSEAVTALTSHDDAGSLNLLSRAYFAMEDWDEAVKYGERAVSLDPNNAAYRLWLGREYGRKAGDSKAIFAAANAKKAKN